MFCLRSADIKFFLSDSVAECGAWFEASDRRPDPLPLFSIALSYYGGEGALLDAKA